MVCAVSSEELDVCSFYNPPISLRIVCIHFSSIFVWILKIWKTGPGPGFWKCFFNSSPCSHTERSARSPGASLSLTRLFSVCSLFCLNIFLMVFDFVNILTMVWTFPCIFLYSQEPNLGLKRTVGTFPLPKSKCMFCVKVFFFFLLGGGMIVLFHNKVYGHD